MIEVRCLGAVVRLDVEDLDLRGSVRSLLRTVTDDGPRNRGRCPVEITVVGTGPWTVVSDAYHRDVPVGVQAVSHVLAAVNLSVMAATPMFAMHAAVLAREGRTLVLPAESGTGKSTLTGALLQVGWDYVSDESLALSWDDGSLASYARPLALSDWSARTLEVEGVLGDDELHVPVTWTVERTPGPVTHVLALRRDRGVRLAPVHRADVLAELLRRSFNHYQRPQRALELLGELVGRAEVGVLHLGDPHEAARVVSQWAVTGPTSTASGGSHPA